MYIYIYIYIYTYSRIMPCYAVLCRTVPCCAMPYRTTQYTRKLRFCQSYADSSVWMETIMVTVTTRGLTLTPDASTRSMRGKK